ncbi:MAG: RNA polymerase-binding protein DksA [Alphaproteobacteria bacterium]|nr:RNA polymerase-binding protein DksA [Alphaproteobacteria bacterium]OJV16086.1 MAG: RNA polymerase-binding protein DksA [Alphaproteobacteria bacterium 33-17]
MDADLTNYKPSEDEPYMNTRQVAYFKKKLMDWKLELINESNETLEHLKESNINNPDPNDRASAEVETAFELRTRDRYKKLIDKIDSALSRIQDGSYGYCIETGDPIGVKRLEARPVAALSIEAQERRENYERTYNEDDE